MPKKILIVDDDAGIRRLLSKFLEREGFTVVLAEDGLEGVEVAKKEQPDLIVLDVVMPRMDGLTAARLIKFYKPLSEVPILFLTAKDASKEIELAQEVRAECYITKPFDVRQVISEIKGLLLD
ncbi:response regulator [candidate division KSB1 bacterium]|nr:response regulator [candidate division KSB1 bacterium]